MTLNELTDDPQYRYLLIQVEYNTEADILPQTMLAKGNPQAVGTKEESYSKSLDIPMKCLNLAL